MKEKRNISKKMLVTLIICAIVILISAIVALADIIDEAGRGNDSYIGGYEYTCDLCGAQIWFSEPVGPRAWGWKQETKNPYTHRKHCLQCEQYFSNPQIHPNDYGPCNHNNTHYVPMKPAEADCTVDTYLIETCSICGGQTGSVFAGKGQKHGTMVNYGDPNQHRCSACENYFEPHTWGEWVDQGNGTETQSCTVCGYTMSRGKAAPGDDSVVIDPISNIYCEHEYVWSAWIDCSSTSHYRDNYCKHCGMNNPDVSTQYDLHEGHYEYSHTSGSTEVYVCSLCGHTKEETSSQPAHEHDFLPGPWQYKNAEQHYRTYMCSCGRTAQDEYENHTIVFDEDSSTPLVEVYKCTKCSYRYNIPKKQTPDIAIILTNPLGKSRIYNGEEQVLVVDGTGSGGSFSYSFSQEGPFSKDLPKGITAGEYRIYWRFTNDEGYPETEINGEVISTISKAPPEYTEPKATNPIYNGTDNTNGTEQVLITTGSTAHGTIEYSSDAETWSSDPDDMPKGIFAQPYTVYWRLIGDENHTSIMEPQVVPNVSILRQPIARVTKSSDPDPVYDASPKSASVNNYDGGKMETGGTFTATDAGNYTATFTPLSNFEWNSGLNKTETITINWKISPAQLREVPEDEYDPEIKGTYTVPSPLDLVYNGTNNENGTAQTLIKAGLTNSGTFKYSLDTYTWTEELPTGIFADTYPVYWMVEGNGNYTSTPVFITSATIRRKPIPRVTASVTSFNYTEKGNSFFPTFVNYDSGCVSMTGIDVAQGYKKGSVPSAYASYVTSFTPKSNFCWNSGENTAETINITWKVFDLKPPVVNHVEGEKDYWTNGTITAKINAQDDESGLIGIDAYSFDNGETWQREPTKTYKRTTRFINVAVRDYAGNITRYTAYLYLDNDNPEFDTSGDSTEWARSRTISITDYRDSDSGIDLAKYPFSYDGGLTWTSSATKLFNQGSIRTVTLAVRDVAGNVFTKDVNVYIDNTLPEYRVIGESKIWAQTRTLSIVNAFDEHSGLVGNSYSFDGGITWTDSPTHSYVGETLKKTVVIVRDAVGNEHAYEANVYVDNIKPTFDVTGQGTAWAKSRTIKIENAYDADSGIGMGSYSYDGGTTWSAIDHKTFTSTTDVILIVVRDRAGNISDPVPANVYVDNEGPVITVTIPGGDYDDSKPIVITAEDPKSGLPDDAFSLDGGKTWIPVTDITDDHKRGVLDTIIDGTTDILPIKVRDVLGNETEDVIVINVDSDAPSMYVEGQSKIWAQERTLTVIAEDNVCDVSELTYSFDGGVTWQSSPEYTYDEGVVRTAVVKCRDPFGNTMSVTANVYIDNNPPTLAVTYGEATLDRTGIAATLNGFDEENDVMYCVNYDPDHPENNVWQYNGAVTLPLNTTVVVACRDEAGNIRSQTVKPTLIDSEPDNGNHVFDGSIIPFNNHIFGGLKVNSYLDNKKILRAYSTKTVNGKEVTGYFASFEVKLEPGVSAGTVSFQDQTYPIYWDSSYTETTKTVDALKKVTAYVYIDAANITSSVARVPVVIVIKEYDTSITEQPFRTAQVIAQASTDIDAPVANISFDPTKQTASVSAFDAIAGIDKVQYRLYNNAEQLTTGFTSYSGDIVIPSNTKYVEVYTRDKLGNERTYRSANLLTYTMDNDRLNFPGLSELNVTDHFRTPWFDYFIINGTPKN